MAGDKVPRAPRGFASRLNDLIAPLAPGLALKRETALAQRVVLKQRMSHFDGAGRTSRGKDFRRNRTDAVEAGRADRDPISFIVRDMLRNNPRARRIRRQLVNQVIGSGIRPTVRFRKGASEVEGDLETIKDLIHRHCLTTAFDADGMLSLLGVQSLAFGTIVTDGEVLIRRRYRRAGDGFALPFQVQVLETDYLDALVDGEMPGGNYAVQGIEFNRLGQRVAYHLFPEHPGGRRHLALASRRISAENVIHAFDVSRPGQQRGVSWLAPVITKLHELDKYQDGQIKRQEIAALFAGIITTEEEASDLEDQINTLEPGSILTLGGNEEMQFTDPPTVEGYEPFMRVTERVIAAGVGMTYESLSGDYSKTNYTSGRMGRMDVDPNVKDWQENLVIAQICAGLARWTAEAIEDVTSIDAAAWEMVWTAPVRPLIDPARDHKADEVAMRAGKKSRRQVIRESGRDPEDVEREILEERTWEKDNDLTLTSNAGSAPRPDGEPGANVRGRTSDNDDED